MIPLYCSVIAMKQAGTWGSATVLQCLHLDTLLLEQRNGTKLNGTKNNCMHVQ